MQPGRDTARVGFNHLRCAARDLERRFALAVLVQEFRLAQQHRYIQLQVPRQGLQAVDCSPVVAAHGGSVGDIEKYTGIALILAQHQFGQNPRLVQAALRE